MGETGGKAEVEKDTSLDPRGAIETEAVSKCSTRTGEVGAVAAAPDERVPILEPVTPRPLVVRNTSRDGIQTHFGWMTKYCMTINSFI